MQPSPEQAINNGSSPLLFVPTELLVKTSCQLSSFLDVFALAATCQRLRCIWTMNVSRIYSHVAPKAIPYERYARSFLADQGRPAGDSLSAGDVVFVIRNSHIVKMAIVQFEKEIIPRINSRFCARLLYSFPRSDKPKAVGFPLEEWYGAPKHPPNLTPTERKRFIRSYYQL